MVLLFLGLGFSIGSPLKFPADAFALKPHLTYSMNNHITVIKLFCCQAKTSRCYNISNYIRCRQFNWKFYALSHGSSCIFIRVLFNILNKLYRTFFIMWVCEESPNKFKIKLPEKIFQKNHRLFENVPFL